MFFHALMFARWDGDVKNEGKCMNVCQVLRQTLKKTNAKPEVFNISGGEWLLQTGFTVDVLNLFPAIHNNCRLLSLLPI